MATHHDDATPLSKFTHRDLRLLSKSSVHSPLRVITLIDFDCFYAQCESVRLGLPPSQPLGVQQFKHVIAMNYAARAAGLKKVTWAEEARKRCPEIVLQHVPTWRPPDTTWRYRDDAVEHMDTDKASLDYYRYVLWNSCCFGHE
jgi:DNA polymerase eta